MTAAWWNPMSPDANAVLVSDSDDRLRAISACCEAAPGESRQARRSHEMSVTNPNAAYPWRRANRSRRRLNWNSMRSIARRSSVRSSPRAVSVNDSTSSDSRSETNACAVREHMFELAYRVQIECQVALTRARLGT